MVMILFFVAPVARMFNSDVVKSPFGNGIKNLYL